MRAVTSRVAGDVDLDAFARGDGYLFVRDGIGVAGRGVAARVDVDEAVELLRSIEHEQAPGHPGCGLVAIGCVPFEPGAPAELVVPAVTICRDDDGRCWSTVVDDAQSEALDSAPPPAPSAAAFTVSALTPVDTYLNAVGTARDAVRSGLLTKVVIARDVLVESDRPIDIHSVLLRLRASFGSSYRYSVDGLIGASPELLVAVAGDVVRSHPLAGTTPRTGDPATDERLAVALVASMKDQVEHRVVIEVVHDTLLPWCSYLDWEAEASIVPVANVQHLGSAVEGRLSDPTPTVVELVRALSPTPALGGHPRDAALRLIADVEGFERGRYGGAVGWVDAHGNGTWAVAIRCAELSPDRRRARLFAGGGIVADSDPAAELGETQAKLQAMLSALVRP